DSLAVQARTVVADLDHDIAPIVLGRQYQLPYRRLARRNALFRGLDAVVQAVAYQMGQRVDDALDQALVQFGGAAKGLQLDLLAHLVGDVAHQPRKPTEHVIHGHHADRHHRLLQIARVALELLHAVEQAIVQYRIQGRGRLRQHGLRNDKLAYQVDDLVDLFHSHADRRRFLV